MPGFTTVHSSKQANLAILALWLCGCLNTTLTADPINPKVFELAAGNPRPIGLSVQSDLPSDIGHQFALLLLPVGRVQLAAPAEHVERTLYLQLSLRGYRPMIGQTSAPNSPRRRSLEVHVTAMQASAYDLLFVRRIVCRVDLQARLFSADGQLLASWSAAGQSSAWRALAFKPQLNALLDQALARSAEQLLNSMEG